jgi:very-short-patch-repair endonuclease
VYALPALGVERLTALAYDGVISHLSAAHLCGLPLLSRPEVPHVIVPVQRRPRRGRPAVLHWAPVTSEERAAGMTMPLRTVLDCSRILPFGEALAVADAALRAGRLSLSELQSAVATMRGPGTPTAIRVASCATPLAESFLESMGRSVLIDAGFTEFEPQVVVYDDGRFVARVDLGQRRIRLALEIEGYQFHGSPAAFSEDCRRYDDLVAAGWLVLRFTYQQILGDPDWVVESVRRAVASRTGGLFEQPGDSRSTRPAEWAA